MIPFSLKIIVSISSIYPRIEEIIVGPRYQLKTPRGTYFPSMEKEWMKRLVRSSRSRIMMVRSSLPDRKHIDNGCLGSSRISGIKSSGHPSCQKQGSWWTRVISADHLVSKTSLWSIELVTLVSAVSLQITGSQTCQGKTVIGCQKDKKSDQWETICLFDLLRQKLWNRRGPASLMEWVCCCLKVLNPSSIHPCALTLLIRKKTQM